MPGINISKSIVPLSVGISFSFPLRSFLFLFFFFPGLNQLIVVSCKSKRQVYCKLCSVKLTCSSHIQEDRHKHNYVVRQKCHCRDAHRRRPYCRYSPHTVFLLEKVFWGYGQTASGCFGQGGVQLV